MRKSKSKKNVTCIDEVTNLGLLVKSETEIRKLAGLFGEALARRLQRGDQKNGPEIIGLTTDRPTIKESFSSAAIPKIVGDIPGVKFIITQEANGPATQEMVGIEYDPIAGRQPLFDSKNWWVKYAGRSEDRIGVVRRDVSIQDGITMGRSAWHPGNPCAWTIEKLNLPSIQSLTGYEFIENVNRLDGVIRLSPLIRVHFSATPDIEILTRERIKLAHMKSHLILTEREYADAMRDLAARKGSTRQEAAKIGTSHYEELKRQSAAIETLQKDEERMSRMEKEWQASQLITIVSQGSALDTRFVEDALQAFAYRPWSVDQARRGITLIRKQSRMG